MTGRAIGLRVSFFKPFIRLFITGKGIFTSQLLPLFDLRDDFDEAASLEAIEKSVLFKGAGVWTLVFAILIASIGLNVNSTAVIIGAMLISPLMGPIVGVGLALGINHFDLLKRALRNLLVATAVGIAASFLYFLISPLSEAQSELLARTQPTLYDVLVAIFGGATGIIAMTRKERTVHALSGVAIATALMPPLCTAGFGLANGHAKYFLGAFYLYAINSVFICLSTLVVVRSLRFKKFSFVDLKTERRVAFYMTGIAIIVAVPSIYTAYRTVSDVVFQSSANKFISESFRYKETKILEKRFERKKEGDLIELTLIGKPLEEPEKEKLRARLPLYGLSGAMLSLNEAGTRTMKDLEEKVSQNLKTEFLERFFKEDQSTIESKKQQISLLEEELRKYKQSEQIVLDLGSELNTLNANISGISVGTVPSWFKSETSQTSRMIAIVRWKRKAVGSEKLTIERFIRARLKSVNCEIIHL